MCVEYVGEGSDLRICLRCQDRACEKVEAPGANKVRVACRERSEVTLHFLYDVNVQENDMESCGAGNTKIFGG